MRIKRKSIPRKKIEDTSDFCLYCGELLEQWQKVIDHFLPHCIGTWGINDPENLVVSCRECNSIKSSKEFISIREAREFIAAQKERKHSVIPIPRGVKRKPRVKSDCKNCGQESESRYGRVFCGRGCQLKYYKANRKCAEKDFKCKFCRNMFTKMAYPSVEYKYCSRACLGRMCSQRAKQNC